MPNPKPRNNADGTISWTVQYRVNGKVVKDTFTAPEPAEDFCRLIDTVGGAQAREVLRSRQVGRNVPTLREWVFQYLDADSGIVTGIEEGTRDGYRKEAERTFLPFLGHYPVDAIGVTDVGKWVAWQEKQTVYRDRNKPEADRAKVSAKTVRNAHNLLSTILKAAVAHKLRDDNPAHGMRLSKGMKREAVFLSPAEFGTVLHFIPAKHRPLVMFLAGTGCRWGEATALTWGDLTLHSELKTARISKAWKRGEKGSSVLKHPKSSRARRTISLFPDLVAALGKPGASSELIFHGQTGGRVRHQSFYSRVWTKAVAKATDKEACARDGQVVLSAAPHIHDLRHSHASWMIAAGVPLPYIQARLGHESITTTVNVYGHLVPDAHEQMASAVATTLADVTGVSGALPASVDVTHEIDGEIVLQDA